jgi:hypothetical protein
MRDPLLEHPGYLGYFTRGGSFVVAIHADWPAYPAPSSDGALLDLGQFPPGTTFTPIDDIDECVLFVAAESVRGGDVWSERAFHIAVWHADLIELSERGILAGVQPGTQREWELGRRETLRAHVRDSAAREGVTFDDDPLDHLFYEMRGEFVPLHLPPVDDEDEDDEDWPGPRCRPMFDPEIPVTLTPVGLAQLEGQQTKRPLPPSMERAAAMLGLGFNDSAVREASVVLETELRQATGSTRYGQKLVDDFVALLVAKGAVNSTVKAVGTAMRTAFKFVRNDFAHGVVDVSPGRTRALLGRFAELLEFVDEVRGPSR